MVFVTLSDPLIIRFHQKWKNEPYYYSEESLGKNEYLLSFEN